MRDLLRLESLNYSFKDLRGECTRTGAYLFTWRSDSGRRRRVGSGKSGRAGGDGHNPSRRAAQVRPHLVPGSGDVHHDRAAEASDSRAKIA